MQVRLLPSPPSSILDLPSSNSGPVAQRIRALASEARGSQVRILPGSLVRDEGVLTTSSQGFKDRETLKTAMTSLEFEVLKIQLRKRAGVAQFWQRRWS